ncbi:HAD family hydrolase [Sedimentitalea sp. XS_ASV28]|uniref:HAD family hydrolase n=1 Tax=Sedimentitalea sp. XS_ASV28 TaxID=3241296 RepID=UPI003519AA57
MTPAAPGLAIAIALALPAAAQDDPLPSWNDGESKRAIIAFVQDVTDENGDAHVDEDDRIATFDNDGTLWVEQPIYTQLAFALDRVRDIAADHPDWKTTQPFQAVLEDDMDALAATGDKGLLEIVAATHAGMSTEQFAQIALDWLTEAKHPRFDKPYTKLVYQPMLELIDYLQDNDFETYIVSGGGIEFMRPWTQEVYNIPPQQVVGSSTVTEYEIVDGKPTLMRTGEIAFVDDKAGKPVGINSHIGRRPIIAFGNSDGDFQMLEYTTVGVEGPSLGAIVHHTDADREYAYDRASPVGKLDKALDAANDNGWLVIDMKTDWKTIFPE